MKDKTERLGGILGPKGSNYITYQRQRTTDSHQKKKKEKKKPCGVGNKLLRSK